MNVDYKLYTAILTRRTERLLPELIHNDQTGFILQRQTQDNVRRTLHMLKHIEENNIQAIILSLDAEKAFDSVRWSYLYIVLEHFGFHKNILKAIQLLYSRPQARIKVNGSLSNFCNLERGTRQGCPLSPLLFSLYIEPLSQWICQNHDIRGIKMGEEEHKIALFADDVLIYLRDPEISFLTLMSTLDTFGSLSGYKVNVQKTQVICYNFTPSEVTRVKYKINYNTEVIKYLGIYLPKDTGTLFDVNYRILNSKLRADIQRWNVIPFLNLGDRVEIIKINMLPRLLYLFQTLPLKVPEEQFKEWDKWIMRFIWQGKKSRILYRTLQLPKERGGLSLPSLKDYYIAAQLRPIVCWCNPDYKARWKQIDFSFFSLKYQFKQ